MNNFRIAYEAWVVRPPETGELSEEERAHVTRLKQACESVLELEWWTDYLNVGKNPRGLHYGVQFGFEVRNANESEFTQKIQEIVMNSGFQFEKGELTIWE